MFIFKGEAKQSLLAPYEMAFSQYASFMSTQSQDNVCISNQQNGLDSITLGQLKAMVGSVPKPKVKLVECKDH
jgi:hypothetical protein